MKSARAWHETALWVELDRRDGEPAETLKRILAGKLPDIESVLTSGDTSPSQFALHDAGHSWRVAEWMAELAGESLLAELGPHDLAMLLLSAYLHDIGMTPPLSRVEAHYTLLLSGDSSDISPTDVAQLQAWLDEECDGVVPPIAGDSPSSEEFRTIRRILAEYIRRRHNDWSEDWILENFDSQSRELYPGWLDDLVALCKSHHFGIEQLRAAEFNPRFVGAPATVLHLRYCACLLRVADSLDFDPERTPAILFTHRDVKGPSAIYWHKDHDLSFVLEDSHISLHAQPADALTHHAIDMTVRDLDIELLTCRRLADETHFARIAGSDQPLPHRWTLDTNVRAIITPRDNAYEYIDGTFRPDSTKLLKLVAGVDLYGSVFAAVREMLQNAFDAVREQVAYQRLLEPDPMDLELCNRLALGHWVELTLLEEEDGLVLTCSDTGTGMSRDIITNRFLVGGTTPRHESRQLERSCQEHGFSVGRTARFGIGVLSYFLLAQHLTVHTRRSIEVDDADGVGWLFSTHGLTDFGELKASPRNSAGTELRLKILPEIAKGDREKFANDLADYVRATVKRTPCRFAFRAPNFGVTDIEAAPGWLDQSKNARRALLYNAKRDTHSSYNMEILPSEKRKLREAEEARWDAVRTQAEESLRIEVHNGLLPDGLGAFRVIVGWFQLDIGKSLAYLDLQRDGKLVTILPFGEHDGIFMSNGTSMSWNGMSVLERDYEDASWSPHGYESASDAIPSNAVLELDWTSDAAGRLAVHRNSFDPSRSAYDAMDFAYKKVEDIVKGIVEETRHSPLGLLNARVGKLQPEGRAPDPWWLKDDGERRSLAPFEFPVTLTFGKQENENSRWRGATARSLSALRCSDETRRAEDIYWHEGLWQPQSVGLDSLNGWPIPIWERLVPWKEFTFRNCTAQFPPTWQALVGVRHRTPSIEIFNASGPLLMAAGPEASGRFGRFGRKSDPLPDRHSMNDQQLAAWVLHCIELGNADLWNGLSERSPDFLPEVWERIDGLSELEALVFWSRNMESTWSLDVVTPTQWERHQHASVIDKEFQRLLGTPDPDWVLTSLAT